MEVFDLLAIQKACYVQPVSGVGWSASEDKSGRLTPYRRLSGW